MDAAYYLLQQVKTQGIKLIDKWVQESLREDLHIDFKRKQNPRTWKMAADDKRNFSRALSGFGNSDSGLIVWGIDAPGSGSALRTKVPIRSVKGFAENLDSQVSRAVNPCIAGVENVVVFEDEANDSGYVITYVPKSINPPHRAEYEGLKQYYKRYGESFKIAEHYELEYMFGTRRVPLVGVFWSATIELPHESDLPAQVPCRIRIGVTNQGKAIASHVCLRLRFPKNSRYRLLEHEKSDLIHYSLPMNASRPHFMVITARAQLGLVVYPGDYMFVFNFGFTLDRDELIHGQVDAFDVYYDLFAEDFTGISNEKFEISGRKIADKLRKKA